MSSSNNRGFTLIEVVVSMMLVLVSLLGLLEMAGLATAANMKNQLRDEAVLIGEKQMADFMTKPQASIPVTAVSAPPTFAQFDAFSSASQIRGTGLKYYVTRQAGSLSSSAYQYRVAVTWTYKKVPYSHEVEAMRSFAGGN